MQVEQVLNQASEISKESMGNYGSIMCCIMALIPIAMISVFIHTASTMGDRNSTGFPITVPLLFGFVCLAMILMICMSSKQAMKSQEGMEKIQQILNQKNTELRPQGISWNLGDSALWLQLSLDYKKMMNPMMAANPMMGAQGGMMGMNPMMGMQPGAMGMQNGMMGMNPMMGMMGNQSVPPPPMMQNGNVGMGQPMMNQQMNFKPAGIM
jgi:hypothetical protein